LFVQSDRGIAACTAISSVLANSAFGGLLLGLKHFGACFHIGHMVVF